MPAGVYRPERRRVPAGGELPRKMARRSMAGFPRCDAGFPLARPPHSGTSATAQLDGPRIAGSLAKRCNNGAHDRADAGHGPPRHESARAGSISPDGAERDSRRRRFRTSPPSISLVRRFVGSRFLRARIVWLHVSVWRNPGNCGMIGDRRRKDAPRARVVEFGRHRGLKILRPQGLAGSSPAAGTRASLLPCFSSCHATAFSMRQGY